MSTRSKSLVMGLVCFTTVGVSRAAWGDILDDILSSSQQAGNRAATARDRATEARDAAREVRDNARDGVAALTDQLRTAINDAVEDLRRTLEDELGGSDYAAFVDGENGCSADCEQFRLELRSFLLDLETVSNTLFVITGLDTMQFDFDRLRGIVDNLPGRVLFPLYRVLAVENDNLLGSIVELLDNTAADLSLVQDVFSTEGMRMGTPLCDVMTENPGLFEATAIALTTRAVATKLVGKLFAALGETTASGDAGIHGYVHITYEDNFPKKFAAIIEAISESNFYVAEAVSSKLEFCLTLKTETDTEARYQAVMTGQQEILGAIAAINCSSTQASADLDLDGDTDLVDYSLFQQAFTGP